MTTTLPNKAKTLQKPATLPMLGLVIGAPLATLLWVGSRRPQHAPQSSRPLFSPAAPDPESTDSLSPAESHGLGGRTLARRSSRLPEGSYGAPQARGGPVDVRLDPDEAAPQAPPIGGLAVGPELPAETWRPEERLQPMALTGVSQTAGGAAAGAAATPSGGAYRPAQPRGRRSTPGASKVRNARGIAVASPAQPVWTAAPAEAQPQESHFTDLGVYPIATDPHAAYLTTGKGATDEVDDPDGWRWRPQTFGARQPNQGNQANQPAQLVFQMVQAAPQANAGR